MVNHTALTIAAARQAGLAVAGLAICGASPQPDLAERSEPRGGRALRDRARGHPAGRGAQRRRRRASAPQDDARTAGVAGEIEHAQLDLPRAPPRQAVADATDTRPVLHVGRRSGAPARAAARSAGSDRRKRTKPPPARVRACSPRTVGGVRSTVERRLQELLSRLGRQREHRAERPRLELRRRASRSRRRGPAPAGRSASSTVAIGELAETMRSVACDGCELRPVEGRAVTTAVAVRADGECWARSAPLAARTTDDRSARRCVETPARVRGRDDDPVGAVRHGRARDRPLRPPSSGSSGPPASPSAAARSRATAPRLSCTVTRDGRGARDARR